MTNFDYLKKEPKFNTLLKTESGSGFLIVYMRIMRM